MRYLIFLLFLSGCATSYKPDGFLGGYSEVQLSEKIWKVSFSGNGYTNPRRAEDLALLRSAELTLKSGYRYFSLMDSRSSKDLFKWGSGSTAEITGQSYGNQFSGTARIKNNEQVYSLPSTTNIVLMKSEGDADKNNLFDAKMICETLGSKYSVSCTY
jgi:hypothetical protein